MTEHIKNPLIICCTNCFKEKGVEEFYGDSLQCKKCHSNNVQSKLEEKIMGFLTKCIEQNVIQEAEIEAARLLVMSCKSRYEACKYNKKGYKGVECNYPDFYAFFFDVIKIDGFWSDWKNVGDIHSRIGSNSSRPTIDRINSLGNYTLDNIQVLPMGENTLKGAQNPCKAMIVKDNSISSISLFEFDSKKDFTEKLSEHFPAKIIKTIKFDTGTVQQINSRHSIILQSKYIDKKKIGNGNTKPKYRLEIVQYDLYYDPDTGEIQKVEHPGRYKTWINHILI